MHNNTTVTSKIDTIFLKCNVIDLTSINNDSNYNIINYKRNNDILIHKNMFDILYTDDNMSDDDF